SGVSWLLASEDTEYRRPVTSAIAAVARFFRSPGLLYLPDDLEPWDDADIWISGGITFTELQQKLLRIRLPSPDFSGAIHCSENRFWIDGYVVENINDACPIGQAAQGM
ncbi:MAG: hypothetical protein V4710_12045, partial [Verrucomicrobiota bacterium]